MYNLQQIESNFSFSENDKNMLNFWETNNVHNKLIQKNMDGESFNFTDDMLEYNQIYKWRIGYNDSAGNMGVSEEFSFQVID